MIPFHRASFFFFQFNEPHCSTLLLYLRFFFHMVKLAELWYNNTNYWPTFGLIRFGIWPQGACLFLPTREKNVHNPVLRKYRPRPPPQHVVARLYILDTYILQVYIYRSCIELSLWRAQGVRFDKHIHERWGLWWDRSVLPKSISVQFPLPALHMSHPAMLELW